MKQLLMLAGAAALAITGPAFAKPGNGNGHGNGHGYAYGLAGERGGNGYGVGGCPPGLAKKAVPCMPPGQARKLYGVGQQIPLGVGSLLGYDSLPRSVRTRYSNSLSPRSRYVSTNGYLYSVNPRTRVVQRVIRTR